MQVINICLRISIFVEKWNLKPRALYKGSHPENDGKPTLESVWKPLSRISKGSFSWQRKLLSTMGHLDPCDYQHPSTRGIDYQTPFKEIGSVTPTQSPYLSFLLTKERLETNPMSHLTRTSLTQSAKNSTTILVFVWTYSLLWFTQHRYTA